MIGLIDSILIAGIALMLGLLGAYFTNWEQNIYFNYLRYIMPPVGISAVLFLFIDQQISLALTAIFIMCLSWYCSTKFWFKKK